MTSLKLGYVGAANPYLSECAITADDWHDCDRPGISLEVWRQILPLINCTNTQIVQAGAFGSFGDGQFEKDSLITMLVNGTIDATLQVMGVDQYRIKATLMSNPIIYAEFGFVRAKSFSPIAPNILLAVFSPAALLLIIGCILVLGLLQGLKTDISTGLWNSLECALNKQKHLERLQSSIIWNPLILLGFSALSIAYFSGFRSQTLSQITVTQNPSVAEIRNWIESRQKRLIVAPAQAAGVMVTQMVDSMFKKGTKIKDLDPLLMPDDLKIIHLLCSRPHDTLFYGNVDVLLASNKRKVCKLEILELPLSAAIGGIYLALAFRPTFPRQTMQRINDVIQRLFAIDFVTTYWFRRYDVHTSTVDVPLGLVRTTTPICLFQLKNGFYVYLAGTCAAVSVFFAEKYNWSFKMAKELHRFSRNLRLCRHLRRRNRVVVLPRFSGKRQLFNGLDVWYNE